MVTTKR